MRRADRLFQIVQMIRRRRITTAAWLAEKLEVSERTIYRDIRDLQSTGVPIDGEAGVGYALPRSFDLPPLMFTEEEIEALVLGARIVSAFADSDLAHAAVSALDRIESVLPDRLRDRIDETPLFSINFGHSPEVSEKLAALRRATREKRKIRFSYVRADGQGSERTVKPLSLSFMAPFWLLSGWCELRDDFRSFRLDRMKDVSLTDERFVDENGQTLEDFLKKVTGQ